MCRMLLRASEVSQAVVMIAPPDGAKPDATRLTHVAVVFMERDTQWASKEAAEKAATQLRGKKKLLLIESPRMVLTRQMAMERGLDWERARPLAGLEQRAEVPDDPFLEETLRMCQAQHEMTAHRAADIVRFLDNSK